MTWHVYFNYLLSLQQMELAPASSKIFLELPKTGYNRGSVSLANSFSLGDCAVIIILKREIIIFKLVEYFISGTHTMGWIWPIHSIKHNHHQTRCAGLNSIFLPSFLYIVWQRSCNKLGGKFQHLHTGTYRAKIFILQPVTNLKV